MVLGIGGYHYTEHNDHPHVISHEYRRDFHIPNCAQEIYKIRPIHANLLEIERQKLEKLSQKIADLQELRTVFDGFESQFIDDDIENMTNEFESLTNKIATMKAHD